MKLEHLRESVSALERQLRLGCGNNGCVIYPPKGLGTNSICRCRPSNIIADLLDMALWVESGGRTWEVGGDSVTETQR